MLLGVQVLAVLDQYTRPEHAARNGKISYKSAADGSPTMDQLPNLPDAPNCRCWSTPVLKPPQSFDNDPAVKEAFANDQGSGIPDPATYDQWFAGADEPRRKLAVGVRRYNAMASVLGDTRAPEWTDFIGPDGALLPVDQLKVESAWDRAKRKELVTRAIEERKSLLGQTMTRGFIDVQKWQCALQRGERRSLLVTPKFTYTIDYPAIQTDAEEFGKKITADYMRTLEKTANLMLSEFQAGRITYEEADHLAWVEVAKLHGLKYRRMRG